MLVLSLLLLELRLVAASFGRVTEDGWQAALAKVPTILERVEPQHRERCERVLRAVSRTGFSQAWQDWILYRNFFAGQTRGLYVDIGSNEPIAISNTAFFDKCLGWEGVCFEPQERYHHGIRKLRSCTLVPNCVLGKARNVIMSAPGPNPGAFSILARGDARAGGSNVTRRGEMRCVGIIETLRRLKLEGRAVDLISIDIEGAEPSVLRCMPWNDLRAKVEPPTVTPPAATAT